MIEKYAKASYKNVPCPFPRCCRFHQLSTIQWPFIHPIRRDHQTHQCRFPSNSSPPTNLINPSPSPLTSPHLPLSTGKGGSPHLAAHPLPTIIIISPRPNPPLPNPNPTPLPVPFPQPLTSPNPLTPLVTGKLPFTLPLRTSSALAVCLLR